MSLAVINYITAPLVLSLGIYIIFKNPKSINSVLTFIFLVISTFAGTFIGLTFDTGNMGYFDLSLVLVRLAGAFSLGMFLSIFRISLSFPYEKKMMIWNIVIFSIWIILSYLILFTDLYVERIELRNGIFFRREGDLYKPMSLFYIAVLLSSIVILAIRKSKFDESIHKLQANIVIWGFAFSALVGVFITIIIPSVFGVFNLYPLSALAGFGYVVSLFYAIVTYRMFDISTVIHKTLLFLLLSSVVGFFAGILSFLAYTIKSNLTLSSISLVVLFIPLLLARNYIQVMLAGIFRRKSDYLNDLKADLNKIDYSKSKEEVIRHFVESIERNIGCSEIMLLYENTLNQLVPEYSYYGDSPTISKEHKAIEFISESNFDVLMRTEVITNPYFGEVRDDVLDIFNTTKSELIVFAREGSNVIGMLCLGKKGTLKDYNVYDYNALKNVVSEIYTFLYYVRNIERTSVVSLVDRELKLSEEVISSIQHSLDKISHNNVDFSFFSKSTSGLGGDFVDIISISSSKYLIVIGDIAGKGLLASMSMATMKTILRLAVRSYSEFKRLVVSLNEFVKLNFPKGSFFSGVFMLVDPDKRSIYYINCGIPVMYMYVRRNNSIAEIQGEGRILGFVKDISNYINVKKVEMKPLDTIVIVTDGVLDSESLSGEKFGKGNVIESIKKSVNEGTRYIVDTIYRDLIEFTGNEIKDDITIFSFRFT